MKELDQLMRNVHFSKRYQGYRYLRRCIMLAAEDEERLTMLVMLPRWFRKKTQKFRNGHFSRL